MATPGHPLTPAPGPPSPDATPLVEQWLDELAARLVGPARARHAVLAELRDGLLEALDAHRSGGLPPDQVARAAIAEFGTPAVVARAFAPELAATQARRAALALVGTGPLIGALWATALATSHLISHPGTPQPPWPWPDLPIGFRLAFAPLGLALAIGVPAGLLTIATTGRLSRWLPHHPPRLAPTAAATIGLACITADLSVLAALASTAATAPGRLAWTPLALAALASTARLLLNTGATHRMLATRAALTNTRPVKTT